MNNNMKDMIDFPVIYTYKAMGENSDEFISEVEKAFESKNVESLIKTPSKKGNYVSVSVTVELKNYDELKHYYHSIKNIKGLKYHL